MDNINDNKEKLAYYDSKPYDITPAEDIYSAPSPAIYTPQSDNQQNQPNYYSKENPDNCRYKN